MQLLQRANFNGVNGSHFFLDLYQDNSQSTPGNASAIRYYAYVGSVGNYSGGGVSAPVYINGTNVGSFSNIGPNSNTLIGYLDVIVPHNNEGKATASYTASADTSWNLGDANISGSFPLPTIPRADSIISPTSGTIGKQVTINMTQNSSTFTHTLRYVFGTLQGTIATGVESSYKWTVPTTFYSQIPNATWGKGALWCDTYSGDTLIGSTYVEFTAYADEADAKPTVSFSYTTDIISQSITGYVDGVIKGVTDINYTITGTAKYSSTISKYYLSKNSSLLQETNSEGTITDADSNTYYVAVKDSRGYTSNISTINFEHYVDYIPLSVTNISVTRENELSSKGYLSLTGTYFNGSFGATNNTLTVQLRYKEKGTSVWETTSDITEEAVILNNTFSITDLLIGENFSTDVSYDVEVILKDKVNTTGITYSKTLTEGTPTFRIRKNDVWYKGIKLMYYENGAIIITNDALLEHEKAKNPVGTLLFNVSGTNPSEYLGFGTWELWGSGRVPVGVDTSQTEFNTVEKTGGEKTHKLTVQELASHSHGFQGGSALFIQKDQGIKGLGPGSFWVEGVGSIPNTSNAGGDQPHNNLQPYITCYIWKRTA